MEETGSVRGVLRFRPSGVVAKGGAVGLRQKGEQVQSEKTDEGGAFRLDAVRCGLAFELLASGRGMAPARFEQEPLEAKEDRDLGVLWVDPAVSVAVSVRSIEGDAPIEGAQVAAFSVPPIRSASDLWSRTRTLGVPPEPTLHGTTGGDGIVRFFTVPAGTWCLVASKTGSVREGWVDPHGGRGELVIRGDEGNVDLVLRLARGLSLSGRVLDATGQPVAGATVVTGFPVLWNPPALFSRTRTDAEGRFTFDDLRAGEMILLVSRDGISLTHGPRVRLPLSGDVDIFLRTGTVAGSVYDADTGQPVPGATVVAGGIGRAEARTDAEGRYLIDSLPPCTVTLILAEKEGWVPADSSDVAGLVLRQQARVPWIQGRTRLEIPLRAGETVVHDILLRRGVRLSGTVKGPEGGIPWAKVTVVSSRATEGLIIPVTMTDASGRFDLPGVPEGPVLVVAEKEGWCQPGFPAGKAWEESLKTGVPPTPDRLDIPRAGAIVHDVVLARGLVLEGRVVSGDGAPLPGATVVISQQTFGYHEHRSLTGEDGSFRVAGLMPGVRAMTWAEKDGWYVVDGSTPLALPLEGSPPEVTIRMHHAARVQGVLTSSSGRPVEGGAVWVSVVTGRRDESGRSVEEGTPRNPVRSDGGYEAPMASTSEGEFTVVASATGFHETRSKPMKVMAGQEVYVVDLVLAESHRMEGRVVTKGSAAGIPGARVFLGHRPEMTWAVTDRDGRFVIEDLDAKYGTYGGGKGVYLVSADSDGYRRGHVQVSIDTHNDLVIELEPSTD
jgi:protocatechuate 3,4-dioxygenase beta subunit